MRDLGQFGMNDSAASPAKHDNRCDIRVLQCNVEDPFADHSGRAEKNDVKCHTLSEWKGKVGLSLSAS